ncbi:hypothetical protein MKW98_019520 [Papaver atlanticum]|uniref:SKI-interacting protein SKIP SNW domain-containing protein n=1 Tax=Papaver atlanticum TaxID=357466 RepID=A0AAD4S8F6_9MAGN|nr:hypothetical protein MKW98_019520 [Papaver atlanticum]
MSDRKHLLPQDNSAKFAEALYVAEVNVRETVAFRSKVRKMLLDEKIRKEQELRALAQEAGSQSSNGGGVAPPPSCVYMPTYDSNMSDGGAE